MPLKASTSKTPKTLQVYDATPYLADHPGGADSILISAGADATDEFNSIHSSKAKAMLAQYYIGDLVAAKDQVGWLSWLRQLQWFWVFLGFLALVTSREGHPRKLAGSLVGLSTALHCTSLPACLHAAAAEGLRPALRVTVLPQGEQHEPPQQPHTPSSTSTPHAPTASTSVSGRAGSKEVVDAAFMVCVCAGASPLVGWGRGIWLDGARRHAWVLLHVAWRWGMQRDPARCQLTPLTLLSLPVRRLNHPPLLSCSPPPLAQAPDSLVVLNPRQKVRLPLVEKIVVSHDTRIFRFGLPSPQHRIGLPVGKHIFFYANVGGQNIVRAYTPISGDEEPGRLDMLIKVGGGTNDGGVTDGGRVAHALGL